MTARKEITNPPPAANPLLAALRARTENDHRRTEDAVDIDAHLADRGGYRRLLERFWGFYAPLEAALAAVSWPDGAAPGGIGAKGPLLAADLKALGVTDPGTLPVCTHLPPIRGWREAIGCHYVLEGSTLGGRVILKRMRREAEADDDALPAAFFSAYGDATGERWRTFCSFLRSHSGDPNVLATAPAAAEATFSALERWLRR